MLFYCVRHGESAFNAEGRIQGQTDVPLSPLGLKQSEALAAALTSLPIEAVFSSPLARAAQTARPVAEALGLELLFEERLKELNAGVFQGRIWDEVRIEYPDAAARWKSSDPDFVIPGGESTVMDKLARAYRLAEPLKARIADGLPVYVTFAGLIILPYTVLDSISVH